MTYAPLTWLVPDAANANLIIASMFVSFFGVFAIRGIYFALLEENSTPKHVAGIGGFQNYFLFLSGIMVAGFMAIIWLIWLRRQGAQKPGHLKQNLKLSGLCDW